VLTLLLPMLLLRHCVFPPPFLEASCVFPRTPAAAGHGYDDHHGGDACLCVPLPPPLLVLPFLL
jgi:hypothetical protein